MRKESMRALPVEGAGQPKISPQVDGYLRVQRLPRRAHWWLSDHDPDRAQSVVWSDRYLWSMEAWKEGIWSTEFGVSRCVRNLAP